MTLEQNIKQKIQEALSPEYLEIVNESHKHAGHAGDDGSGETHFKLMVVSSEFEGYDRISRHRLVYKILEQFLVGSLHALALKTYTPSEYKEKH